MLTSTRHSVSTNSIVQDNDYHEKYRNKHYPVSHNKLMDSGFAVISFLDHYQRFENLSDIHSTEKGLHDTVFGQNNGRIYQPYTFSNYIKRDDWIRQMKSMHERANTIL